MSRTLEEWAADLARQEAKMTELEEMTARLEKQLDALEEWARNNGGRAIEELEIKMARMEKDLGYTWLSAPEK